MNDLRVPVLTSTSVVRMLVVVVFFVVSTCAVVNEVFAQSTSEDTANIINQINHEKKFVVINDEAYIMSIGLDVYIFEGKTRTKRKANRYALKKGDIVFFTREIRNQRNYVSEITIVR